MKFKLLAEHKNKFFLKTIFLVFTILPHLLTVTAQVKSGDVLPSENETTAFHQQSSTLTSYPYYTPALKSQYLLDPSNKLTINDIVLRTDFIFPDKENSYWLGYSSDTLWVRAQLDDMPGDRYKWLVEVDNPVIDFVTVYFPNQEGVWDSVEGGFALPFDTRTVKHKNHFFQLPDNQVNGSEFYFQISSNRSVHFDLNIWSEREFIESGNRYLFWYGIFFGILLVMVISSVLLYSVSKESSIIYYALYILAFMCFSAGLSKLLWPNSPMLTDKLLFADTYLLGVILLIFTKKFLDTPKNMPQFNIWLNVLIFAHLFVLSITIYKFTLFGNIIASQILLVAILSCLIAGYLSWRQSFKYARLFMFSFFLLFTESLVFITSDFGLLNITSDSPYLVFSTLQLSFMHLAIKDKIKFNQIHKNQAHFQIIENQKKSSSMIKRYIPMELSSLINNKENNTLKLGRSIEKDMTLLYIDIHNINNNSLNPAWETFEFYNAYLGCMEKVIYENQGIVYKFISGKIIALFPDDPALAIEAAIKMQKSLPTLDSAISSITNEKIRIGVGVHFGSLLLGAIGVEEKMDIAVISDNVCISERIEKLTRIFNVDVLLSESCLKKMEKSQFHMRYLGKVKQKGTTHKESIYELLDVYEPEQKTLRINSKKNFNEAMKLFQNRDYVNASQIFDQILQENPEDYPASFLLAKCAKRIERANSC